MVGRLLALALIFMVGTAYGQGRKGKVVDLQWKLGSHPQTLESRLDLFMRRMDTQ